MQTIGDKLEEARKRQGLSIREAAEATKVRSDFLLNFENNNFEFDIPDVYKRGFLRLYAKFLNLDADKVLTDYQAIVLGRSKHSKRENKEFFGRIDLPESKPPLGGADSEPPEKSPSTSRVSSSPSTSSSSPNSGQQPSDSSFYVKIGLVVGGSVAIVILVILIIGALLGGDGTTTDESGATVVEQSETTTLNPDLPEMPESTAPIILTAAQDVHVLARQENGEARNVLFNRTLKVGEKITLDRVGPVRIVCTDFQQLSINIDGRIYRSKQGGPGQRVFN